MSPGWLRRRILGIPSRETTLARRGFRVGDRLVGSRLEHIGAAFLRGYHASLEEDGPETLCPRLDAVEPEWRGFAYEGAAMGLALVDQLTPAPWRPDRLRRFLEGPGSAHVYMVHVGAGWVLGRLPLRMRPFLSRLDPTLRWLALDGYGFHEGYFHWPRSVSRRAIPGRLSGYARRAFDQGLGRSLWFVEGADVARIPGTIAAFPAARQADLWSGVGLACAYAGGVDLASLVALQGAAGSHRGQLAQGAAFAAKARQRAGNPASHTEAACRVFCALSAGRAAGITDAALHGLPADAVVPAYEVWRRRIREQFGAVCEVVP